MLPAMVLAPDASHAVLDMCAAPGSKTAQLLETMELDHVAKSQLARAGAVRETSDTDVQPDEGSAGANELELETALAIGLLATAVASAGDMLPPPSPAAPPPLDRGCGALDYSRRGHRDASGGLAGGGRDEADRGELAVAVAA